MERLKRAAIVAKLVENLRNAGSWCGETNIQKATYLLQDLLAVPTDFCFVLYKHGPYSFDLSDELTSLRGDELLSLQPQAPPYGPRYALTESAKKLLKQYPKTLARYEDVLARVGSIVGAQTVTELERLTTALYVTKRCTENHDGSVKFRADHLRKLKPHVSFADAKDAVKEIDNLLSEVSESDE